MNAASMKPSRNRSMLQGGGFPASSEPSIKITGWRATPDFLSNISCIFAGGPPLSSVTDSNANGSATGGLSFGEPAPRPKASDNASAMHGSNMPRLQSEFDVSQSGANHSH